MAVKIPLVLLHKSLQCVRQPCYMRPWTVYVIRLTETTDKRFMLLTWSSSVLPARSRCIRCNRPLSPCFPIGPKAGTFPVTAQTIRRSNRHAAESLSLQRDWTKSCRCSASVQALVSTPALYSMIIIAVISRTFTEIVFLFSVSEYDGHAKDVCPHVFFSAKSDPKDLGIWCGKVLYECEIWCIIFKKKQGLKERGKLLLRKTLGTRRRK